MSTTPVDPNLEALRGIHEYLAHDNVQVREEALKILKGFSVEDHHLEYIYNELKPNELIRYIIRILTNDKPSIGLQAQMLLVNYSANENLRDIMINLGIIDICMEWLIHAYKNQRSPRLILMLLINITLSTHGALELMQDGKTYESLHVQRLIRWYIDPTILKTNVVGTDDWGKIGPILSNLSQMESFRRVICDNNHNYIISLKIHLQNLLLKPNDPYLIERAMSTLKIYHNVAYDVDKQYIILKQDNGILSLLLSPIITYDGDGAISLDALKQIPNDIKILLSTPTKRFNNNLSMRELIIEILLILVRNPPSRRYLRASNVYYIIRELHKYERELGNENIDNRIDDDLIQYFILDEDWEEGEYQDEIDIAVEQLIRQSQMVTWEDIQSEEEKKKKANEPEKPIMAQLEPTGDGEIQSATEYNDARKKRDEDEEKRMDEILAKNMEKMKQNVDYSALDVLLL